MEVCKEWICEMPGREREQVVPAVSSRYRGKISLFAVSDERQPENGCKKGGTADNTSLIYGNISQGFF